MGNAIHKSRWTYCVTYMSRKHGCPSPKGGQASIPDRDRAQVAKTRRAHSLLLIFYEDVNLSPYRCDFDCLSLFL